jgi:hypothetical protein
LINERQFPAALPHYQAAIAIATQLTALDPGNHEWREDLSFYREKIADLAWQAGDLGAALESYRACLEIEAGSQNHSQQFPLAIIQLKLSALAFPGNSEADRKSALAEGLRIIHELQLEGRLSAKQRHTADIILQFAPAD